MVLYVDGKGERGKKMTSFKMQSLKGLLIAYRRRKDKKENKPIFSRLKYVYGYLVH